MFIRGEWTCRRTSTQPRSRSRLSRAGSVNRSTSARVERNRLYRIGISAGSEGQPLNLYPDACARSEICWGLTARLARNKNKANKEDRNNSAANKKVNAAKEAYTENAVGVRFDLSTGGCSRVGNRSI